MAMLEWYLLAKKANAESHAEVVLSWSVIRRLGQDLDRFASWAGDGANVGAGGQQQQSSPRPRTRA